MYNISINKLYEEFDLNYATGFHKSQGSGWKTIVVFIEPNAGFIKQKAIYTSISRSKEKLILVCRPEDLLNCQNPEDERKTLFMNKIHYSTL
jgi:ATP-dependent exoDNAse (exonuclease V) alpha subunit